MNTHEEQEPAQATIGDLLRSLTLLLFIGVMLFGAVIQALDELHVAPPAVVMTGIIVVAVAYCWLMDWI